MAKDSVRTLPPQDSEILATPLEDIKPAMARLLKLTRSCYGIHGSVLSIQNDQEDYVASTSVSNRILQLMHIPEPLLKIVCVGVSNHMQNYLDYGLFSLNFCLTLIEKGMELNTHRHLYGDFLDVIAGEVFHMLAQSVSFKVFGNATDKTFLYKVIRAIVAPKRNCGLLDGDLEHLQNMIVDVFFKTSGESLKHAEDAVQFMMVEGKEVQDSVVSDGVLYADFAIPTDEKDWGKGLSNHGAKMRVVMLDISMAGDTDDFMVAEHQIEASCSKEQTVIKEMKNFVDKCLEKQVDFVLCQKVIHPLLKKYFREKNIRCLERLGKKQFLATVRLAGCTAISSFQTPLENSHVGVIEQISHRVFNEKSYVELSGGNNSKVFTVVLCHLTDELLQEMAAVFRSAVHSLRLLQRQPVALAGGGCWQSVMMAHLVLKARKNRENWCQALRCQPATFTVMFRAFLRSLQMSSVSKLGGSHAAVDSVYYHSWFVHDDTGETSQEHCSCGAVKKTKLLKWLTLNDLVELDDAHFDEDLDFSNIKLLDCLATVESAVMTAISLAKTVIGIHAVVIDKIT